MVGRVDQDLLARIELLCIDGDHIQRGRGVPDGHGHFTLVERRWAYCSAGIPNAPHEWTETGGVDVDDIRHDKLPQFRRA